MRFTNLLSENPLWKEIVLNRIALRDINLKFWLEYNLFSSTWWVMLIVFVLFWYFWWKRVDKTRLLEIVTCAFMIETAVTVLDIIGVNLVLWGYPNMMVPLMPPLFIIDYGVLPVSFSLVYQSYSKWNTYMIAVITLAGVLSFIGEPVAIKLGMYEMNHWRHIYSFPIYIVCALLLKAVLNQLTNKQKYYS